MADRKNESDDEALYEEYEEVEEISEYEYEEIEEDDNDNNEASAAVHSDPVATPMLETRLPAAVEKVDGESAIGVDEATDDDSDYYDEEEEYEEDEEYEEEEPERLLKYDAWRNAVLKGKTVTSIHVTDRAIVVGTSSGHIIVLDSEGFGQLNTGNKLRKHESPVKDISVDQTCDYIASVCEGGVLFVQNLGSAEFLEQQYDRPLQCVALHPRYKFIDDKPFICAGYEGRVLLSSKGFFMAKKSRKVTTLDDNCGRVFATRWRGNFASWATEREIVVYNVSSRSKIYRLSRLASAPRPELFRCNMMWESDTSLIIAWGNFVRIIRVTPPSLSSFETHGKAELEYGFETKHYRICGLAPFDSNGEFLVLLTSSNLDGSVEGGSVEVRIVYRGNGFERVCEQLSVKSKKQQQNCLPITQYILCQTETSVREENLYLIVTPMLNMCARRADNDDKIEFYLQQDKHVHAFEFAKCNFIRTHSLLHVGEGMLNFFLKKEKFSEIATYLAEVYGNTEAAGERWEHWVKIFIQNKHVQTIVPFVPYQQPTMDHVTLSTETYNNILLALLEENLRQFKKYVHKFRRLYAVEHICIAAASKLQQLKIAKSKMEDVAETDINFAAESVGLLWEFRDDYSEALRVFLDIRDGNEIFEFIQRHNLHDDAASVLVQLFEKNPGRTLALLCDPSIDENEGALRPQLAFETLLSQPDFLWQYVKVLLIGAISGMEMHLERKFSKILEKYAFETTRLIIDWDTNLILSFLEKYWDKLPNLRKAFELTRDKQCVEASAFIIAKMGDIEKGLKMLIDDLKNVSKAIVFITSHQGTDEEKGHLFMKLVELVLHAEKRLEGSRTTGQFMTYQVKQNSITGVLDTWTSIAKRYSIEVQKLKNANPKMLERPLQVGATIRVPINMIETLLTTIADPLNNTMTIDPVFLIRQLRRDHNIPDLGTILSRILSTKKQHLNLMQGVSAIVEEDIVEGNFKQVRKLSSAIRIDPMIHYCDSCHERTVCRSDVVAFRNGHLLDAQCGYNALRDRGAIRMTNALMALDDEARARKLFTDPMAGVSMGNKPLPRRFPYDGLRGPDDIMDPEV